MQLSWDVKCDVIVGRRVCSYRGTWSVQLSWDVECAAIVGRRVCSYCGTWRAQLSLSDWDVEYVCSYRGL